MELKERIAQRIDKLAEDKLGEVLDFVDFLVSRQGPPVPDQASQLDPPIDEDPLIAYIGGVEHGSLAQDIDKELYGT